MYSTNMDSFNSFSLKMIHEHPKPKKLSTCSTYYNHRNEAKAVPQEPKKYLPILSAMRTNPFLKINPSNITEKLKPIDNKSKTKQSFLENIVLILRTFPCNFLAHIIHPPLHPSVDPKRVFVGNFAPVDELGPTECQVVEGELPSNLNGVYIRNGPNPQHMPRGPLHFFEGDGMLHSIQLSKGRAIYASRYVYTYKYKLEREAGFPIFPNVLSGFYGLADIIRSAICLLRVLFGLIDLKKGFGLANTSLALISSKLLALCESDLPYIVELTQEGDIETSGRWDVDKKIFANMTAHPKTDIVTKETFAFKLSRSFPYLNFFRFNENGVKLQEVCILSMDQPTPVHDLAITNRFAIFVETQLVVAPANMMLGRGMPVVYDPRKVPRIGILLRYATSDAEMKWFSVPGFNAMHLINAWENGDDEVILVAPNARSIENIFHRIDSVHFSLEKVRINLRTGDISRNVLSMRSLEMGSINHSFVGKKSRYGYLGIAEQVPKMSGVVKIDLEMETEISTRFYGPGCFGGEPLFVARDAKDKTTDEDDGFVVTFVHDENLGESKVLVMDAKSPNLDIVAALKLPRRVPYGFHGLFVHTEDPSTICSS